MEIQRVGGSKRIRDDGIRVSGRCDSFYERHMGRDKEKGWGGGDCVASNSVGEVKRS